MEAMLGQQLAPRTVPGHVAPSLVVDFDACNDAGLKRNVFGRLDELRRAAPPIAWSPYNGGHWLVFREEDMQAILTSPDDFTTAHLSQASTSQGGPPFIPLGLEPPEHAPWRNLLVRYLGPTKIKQLESAVRKRAHELIAPLVQRDRCDFVTEVAEPMPVTIFMEMMGLPLELFPEFRRLALEILDPEGLYDPAEQQARAGAPGHADAVRSHCRASCRAER